MRTRFLMASLLQNARWAFNVGTWSPSEKDWQLMASGLDTEDKEQIGKFVFQKDAKSAMIGRYLTKKFVSETTGLNWRDIKIFRNSIHKKPYLPQELFPGPRVQFNISHSGDFVVLAGEMGDVDLGVDLMKIEKQRTTSVPEFFRLMNKQFAEEEWAVVKSLPTEAEQMAMFYRFWCLKESYTKATGTGITVDLQKICFKLKNLSLSENIIVDDTEVYVDGQKQYGWKFEESMIRNDHIVVVALHSPEVFLKFQTDMPLFRLLSFFEVVSLHQNISDVDVEYCKKYMAKRLRP